jgi:hypothetical protein
MRKSLIAIFASLIIVAILCFLQLPNYSSSYLSQLSSKISAEKITNPTISFGDVFPSLKELVVLCPYASDQTKTKFEEKYPIQSWWWPGQAESKQVLIFFNKGGIEGAFSSDISLVDFCRFGSRAVFAGSMLLVK